MNREQTSLRSTSRNDFIVIPPASPTKSKLPSRQSSSKTNRFPGDAVGVKEPSSKTIFKYVLAIRLPKSVVTGPRCFRLGRLMTAWQPMHFILRGGSTAIHPVQSRLVALFSASAGVEMIWPRGHGRSFPSRPHPGWAANNRSISRARDLVAIGFEQFVRTVSDCHAQRLKSSLVHAIVAIAGPFLAAPHGQRGATAGGEVVRPFEHCPDPCAINHRSDPGSLGLSTHGDRPATPPDGLGPIDAVAERLEIDRGEVFFRNRRRVTAFKVARLLLLRIGRSGSRPCEFLGISDPIKSGRRRAYLGRLDERRPLSSVIACESARAPVYCDNGNARDRSVNPNWRNGQPGGARLNPRPTA